MTDVALTSAIAKGNEHTSNCHSRTSLLFHGRSHCSQDILIFDSRRNERHKIASATERCGLAVALGPKKKTIAAAITMNPVDNDNMKQEKMRNKTPWFWQNFCEGLADEALPNSGRGPGHPSRGLGARLADEQLVPEPMPLLSGDSLCRVEDDNGSNVKHVTCSQEQSHGARHSMKEDYIVVEKNHTKDINPECSQEHSQSLIAPVAKWKLEEEEALNPRWNNLSDSFKELGLQ